MNITAFLGIAISLTAVVLSICFQESMGNHFDLASLRIFFDTRSFLLILGGTLGATITQYPLSLICNVITVISRSASAHIESHAHIIASMTTIAEHVREHGITSLKEKAMPFTSPFIKKGFQLTLDGLDPVSIKSILEAEIDNMQVRHERGASVLESMATYAPALGMMGTVVGLVQMLRGMNDPSGIGPKMALALITTFYGVVLANLVFLPLAGRLRLRSQEEIFLMEIEMEGIIGIASGESPKVLYEKLTSFQSPKDRKKVK